MAQGRQEDVARGAGIIARSGLRFDRVAVAFVARLRDELSQYVPAGKTLVVTCTAPIRKDSKTAVELIAVLGDALARGRVRLEFKKTINDNRIRARLVKGGPERVVGFVHNPDIDPETLLT